MSAAAKVLGFVRDFTATAADEIGLIANLRLAPALPVVPERVVAAKRRFDPDNTFHHNANIRPE